MKNLLLTLGIASLCVGALALTACDGGQTPNRPGNSNMLSMPTLYMDENGLVTWNAVDGAIHYECYVNRGLSEDGMQSVDERFEKTPDCFIQLSLGDTVEVYACGENEQRSQPNMATYLLSGDSSRVDNAVNKLGNLRGEIEWMQYEVDDYNTKLSQLKTEYESAFAAAATEEARDDVVTTYTQKAYAYYGKTLVEQDTYSQLMPAAAELESLMEQTVIYTCYSKLDVKSLRAEVASYKDSVQELQASYEGRMSVSSVYVTTEALSGETTGAGEVLLITALNESTPLENLYGEVNGYLVAKYDVSMGDSGSITYDISVPYQALESFNFVSLIYTPNTYTITYNMGAFSGAATCIGSTAAQTTETVSLPLPYCDELFFDYWMDENGTAIANRQLYFDYGKDVTLTAVWTQEPDYFDKHFYGKNSHTNEDGMTVVTIFGFVEAVFGENGNRYFYVRPDGEDYGYLVRNPLIRAAGETEWLGNATNAETEAFFYDERQAGLYYEASQDVVYFNGCYVCVQGMLFMNEGRMELTGAKIINTRGGAIAAGSMMRTAVDHTLDFKECTDYKALKGIQNSIVTLHGCTISQMDNGDVLVGFEGGNLGYKLKTDTMQEQGVSTAWVNEALTYNVPVTLRVIVRYYEDKNGNAEVWLEPAPESLFITVES